MLVKTQSANISYYPERYNQEEKPELSGIRHELEGRTIYWFNDQFGDLSDIEVTDLLEYLNSLPDLFRNSIEVPNIGRDKLSNEPWIFLNKFVVEIRNCELGFKVYGRLKEFV